jgi:hypothetical protein
VATHVGRRAFLGTSAAAVAATLARGAEQSALPLGKAEHCIMIWLGGGMAQVDTFDPKPLGDARAKPPRGGSYYPAIDTAVPGVQVTEHLARTARLMEQVTAVRTVNHRVVDEHAFATNLVHTGRMISGSTIYPSIGSIVAHQRGAADPAVPAYMLIGYPAGFTRPADVTEDRAAARQRLLAPLQQRFPDGSVPAEYLEAQADALRLAGPGFMRHFRLDEEPGSLRDEYGGEFGQRCLLARRLVQSGVRFIEVSQNLNFVNGTGWDTHNDGQLNQHVLIRELDQALAALISDLDEKGLLDRTLIVVATEFGRPAAFDGGGGRGHQGTAFSLVLAGGGLAHRGAYGVTDDDCKAPVEAAVSIPDFHATILAALGVPPHAEMLDGARPVPVTDGGVPIAKLFT